MENEKIARVFIGKENLNQLERGIEEITYNANLNNRLFQDYELPAIYSLDSREKMVNLIWLLFKYPYLFNNEKLS